VADEGILKLLDLVQRELGAADARIEIGGADPTGDRVAWVPAGPSRRIVAIFADPPNDMSAKMARLAALADAFAETATAPAVRETLPPASAGGASRSSGLDLELRDLCGRSGALGALIIDGASPVIWGVSHPELRGFGDVEQMLAGAEALRAAARTADGLSGVLEDIRAAADKLRRDGQHGHAEVLGSFADQGVDPEVARRWLLCARAVRSVRERLDESPSRTGNLRLLERADAFGLLARSLAGVYVLALAFDSALSEVRAEGAVRRVLDQLERKIASLPPVDPRPPGGKPVRLHPVNR
jgi:hypothetical protein